MPSAVVQVALGDRARAGLGDEAAERQVAERGLVALAEQVEQRRALGEVVVGVGRRCRSARAARRAGAGTRPRPPGATRGSSALGGGRQALLGVGEPVGGDRAPRRR